MIDYEETSAEVTAEDLNNIAGLAVKLRAGKAKVEELQGQLKSAMADVRKIEEEYLPTAMHALGGVGLESFTLADGTGLQLKKTLHMSVPKKNLGQVCDWLVSIDHGSLVRTNVALDFGAGESEKAQAVEALLVGAGYDNATSKRSVNTATLKALAKELMEQGEDVPLQMMGGYEREFVEVKTG